MLDNAPFKGDFPAKRKSGSGCRMKGRVIPTSSNNVIYDEDLLAWLDGALLHLEVVGTVFLGVFGGDAGSWQLALLANRHKASIQSEGQAGAEEETAGVKADDDIGLDGVIGAAEVEELQLERAEESCVDGWVEKPWHNIQEVDAGDGEVGEAAQGLLEAYLCTGEFGGGGGGGGGLSSRGILGGGGGGRGRGCRGVWVGGQVALGLRGWWHGGEGKRGKGRGKGEERW